MPALAKKQGRKGTHGVIGSVSKSNGTAKKTGKTGTKRDSAGGENANGATQSRLPEGLAKAVEWDALPQEEFDRRLRDLQYQKKVERRKGLPENWANTLMVYPRHAFEPDTENRFDLLMAEQWEAMNDLLKEDYVIGLNVLDSSGIVLLQYAVAVVEHAYNPVELRYDEIDEMLYIANRYRAPANTKGTKAYEEAEREYRAELAKRQGNDGDSAD